MNKTRLWIVGTCAGLVGSALFIVGCQDQGGVSPTGPVASQIIPLAKEDERRPSVPPILEVPAGNEVNFHAFARGVQIYRVQLTAPGYAWVFIAPEATLYASRHFHGVVGTHFAGPTWQSNSGSRVVAARIASSPSPDPNAIPWLLLQAVSTSGHGPFSRVTYVQRINTFGGKAPTTGADAEHVGELARVPYTAEYYFYRADD